MRPYALMPVVAIAMLATATGSERAWIDGKVVSVGHVSNDDGKQIPTATVVMYDPDNSNPLSRKQVFVITVAADARKTKVVLSIGSSFKAYRSGETARGYGFLAIRYLDASVLVRSDPPVLG